jgi:hypothetical protein
MKKSGSDFREIECFQFFPETAVSARIRISHIRPRDSAVLMTTPRTGTLPVRFAGPEDIKDVPVQGHWMWVQGVDDNIEYRIECLGFEDGSRSLKAERSAHPLVFHTETILTDG